MPTIFESRAPPRAPTPLEYSELPAGGGVLPVGEQTVGMGILCLVPGRCFRGSASSLSPYKLLPPLNVAWNRWLPTTLGPPPHRPSVFVLSTARFGF